LQVCYLEQLHHLPDLNSFDEVITLLHLLNVITLEPILYWQFYLSFHTITSDMFQTWANGQEQALEILQHINSHYAFYMEKRPVPFQSIVHTLLSHNSFLSKASLVRRTNTDNKQGGLHIFRAIHSSYSCLFLAIKLAVEVFGKTPTVQTTC